MPGIPDQYRIIKAGAGWRRKEERGRLRIGGNDRRTFLQALLTNDVAALGPGEGTYAAYLTPQGRMIADLHVFARADHILADVPASNAAELAAALDGLVFAEDVQVSDESTALVQYTVLGAAASDVLARAIGISEETLRALGLWQQVDVTGGFVARTDDAAVGSFDVVLASAGEAGLVDALSRAGAGPVSEELWTAVRVDAGRPAFGIDMGTDTIPLEAGLLDRAISTTKGCYVGQEIIIRVLHRGGGRVARRLVKMTFDADAGPLAAGATLRSGDSNVGRLTTVTSSLEDSRIVALASVHRDVAEIGHRFETDVATGVPAQGVVVSLAG